MFFRPLRRVSKATSRRVHDSCSRSMSSPQEEPKQKAERLHVLLVTFTVSSKPSIAGPSHDAGPSVVRSTSALILGVPRPAYASRLPSRRSLSPPARASILIFFAKDYRQSASLLDARILLSTQVKLITPKFKVFSRIFLIFAIFKAFSRT